MILLVDDDPLVRELVRDFLELAGHAVVEACSGEAALDAAESVDSPPIDLVVTDMALPGIDGATLAKHLRQSRSGLPVLLVSGNPLSAAAFADDRTVVLTKPFTRETLLGAVRMLLGLPA